MAAKKRKGLLRAKLFVVMTDYDVHTMWLHAGVDRYFCATSEMAYALEGLGVERSKISVSGIPVFRQFDSETARREDMRLKLELHPKPADGARQWRRVRSGENWNTSSRVWRNTIRRRSFWPSPETMRDCVRNLDALALNSIPAVCARSGTFRICMS